MQEPQDCPVCSSAFTSVARRKVVCPTGCGFDACAKCVTEYLKSPLAQDLACMNPDCRAPWTIEFLSRNIWSAEAVNCIQKNQRDIAVSLDRSRRAEALELVAATRERKQLIRQREEISAELAEKERALHELRDKRRRLSDRIAQAVVTPGGARMRRLDGEGRRVTWEYPCSVPDCRGLVSTSGQCHVCETWICKQCGVPTLEKNDEGHTCRQEDIDTVRELRNNTKPCPNCATLISRTEGCPQMHCVACRTNFDWNTGRILQASAVMNPHLAQWRLENPDADPDAPNPAAREAGGCVVTPYGINDSMYARNWPRNRSAFRLFSSVVRVACNAHRYARDVGSWVANIMENDKTVHGVKFYMGDSTDAQWTNAMRRSWEKRQRVESCMHIWQTFSITISDTLRAAMRDVDANDNPALMEIFRRLVKIRDWTNEQFRAQNPIYKGKLPRIEPSEPPLDDWDQINLWTVPHFGQPVSTV